MNRLPILMTVVAAMIAAASPADARPRYRESNYVIARTSCGCPVHVQRHVAYYDRCGHPVFKHRRLPVIHRCRPVVRHRADLRRPGYRDVYHRPAPRRVIRTGYAPVNPAAPRRCR